MDEVRKCLNERERISRRNQIEEVLQIKLDALIEKIKLEPFDYNSQLNEILRAGIQASYQLAVDYVTQKVKKDAFLTSTDLEIIKEQVDSYSVKFQRKVDSILHRNDVLLQKYNYEPRSPLNSNYMASVLAIGIVTTTMAKATLAKIAQLKSSIKSAGILERFFRLQDIFTGKGSGYGVPRDEFEDQVQWNAILDDRTCQYCLSLHGSFWYYNDPHKPIPGDDFDIHPNCVLGDTLIDSTGIKSILRSRYNGPVIELCFSNDRRITVTPNHMFLTPNGFAAADLLNEGDDVIDCSNFQSICNPNNNNNPSRISDIFESFSKCSKMFTMSMPSTTEYLHGDSRFCDGNIDIIRTDGFLRNDIGNLSISQHGNTLQLQNTSNFPSISFSRQSPFTEFFKTISFAADSSMGLFREFNPFFSRRLRHTEKHGFTPVPRNNSIIFKSDYYSRSADTKYLGKLLNRFPRIIETNKIVDVNINLVYSGFVYDLESPTTTYIGNGHILSNCRCMWDYLPSIVDIPLVVQLAKLTRQTQTAIQDLP